LPKEQWELLLVDNAGNPPLAGTYNPRSHEELIQLLKSDLPPLDSKAALMYFA
jgi:hypothetical protein